MNRLSEKIYNELPWSQSSERTFEKPKYGELARLKKVPLHRRDMRYVEYYEFQTFLDIIGAPHDNAKVLDAGAGVGTLSYILSHLGEDITACDIDRNGIKHKLGHFLEVDFNGDSALRQNSYDYIVCKQVIEHIFDPRKLLKNFYDALKPGGCVILSTPNIASLCSRFMFFRSGDIRFFEHYWKDHCSILHHKQLEYFLKNIGFVELEWHTEIYEMYNMDPVINGKRQRFLVPFIKAVTNKDQKDVFRYGKSIIVKAKKQI